MEKQHKVQWRVREKSKEEEGSVEGEERKKEKGEVKSKVRRSTKVETLTRERSNSLPIGEWLKRGEKRQRG